MRASTIARPQFQRSKGHNRLIRHRGRAERHTPHIHQTLYGWVVESNSRRIEVRRARLHVALHGFTNQPQQLLILVALINSHIDHKLTLGRHYVMLRSCLHTRNRHLHRTKHWRHTLKTMRTKPLDILQRLIDSIYALLACCVTSNTIRRTIEHHQALLGNSGIHSRRFADNSKINLTQLRKHGTHAIHASNLLLSRGKHYQIIRLLRFCQLRKGNNHSHQASARIVTTQAIQLITLNRGRKGIARPLRIGLHRVNMGIEQNRRLRLIALPRLYPHIITHTPWSKAHLRELRLHNIGSGSLVTANRGRGN